MRYPAREDKGRREEGRGTEEEEGRREQECRREEEDGRKGARKEEGR